MPKTKTRNPLSKYLDKHGIKQIHFAHSLSVLVGWQVSRSQVCRWVAGTNKPSRPWRRFIAQATAGEVAADVW